MIPAESADEVAALLGDLPLALTQAAGLMAASGMPAAEYVQLFRTHQRALLTQATRKTLLGAAAPGTPQQPATWPAYAELLPHVAAVETCHDARFRDLLLDTGWYLYFRGDPVGCRELARSAAGRFTSALGGDADDTLSAHHLVAIAAWALGDYARPCRPDPRLPRRASRRGAGRVRV